MPYTYISIYIYKYVCVRVSVWNTTLFQNIYVHQCAFWLSICRCGDENRIHQDHLKREGKPLNGVSSRNIPWVKKLVKSCILFCCHQRWKDGVEIEAFMRCTLQPNLSSKCHFAPNALSDSQLAGGLVKRAAVGGVFVGRLTKVTNLVHCRIIWDCNIQREPPATLKPSKPKLYLVCTTKLEPGFFYKLS